MKKSIINGYAVVRKSFIGKSFEAVGVGRSTCEAWNDANQNENGGRYATRDMPNEFKHWKCVPAKISISFDIEGAS